MTRPFHRQQYRTAPFPADADPLNHPQDRQEHRAPDADRLIGRDKGNQESRDAHAQKRGDQGRLAPDAVAVMAKDRGADWPADKADEVGAEGGKGRGQRFFVGEIEVAENQSGRGAVDEEVIPFDRRADGRGDNCFAQLCAVLGRRQRLVCDRGHRDVPPAGSSPSGQPAPSPV